MDATPLLAIDCVWVVLILFWLAAAVAVKHTVRRDASGSRAAQIAIMIAAFLLLFDPRPLSRVQWLGFVFDRFLPPSTAFSAIGLGLTLAGVAFAIWARLRIGGNWSGSVTIKQDHTLVRSGPYAIVRHPIYSGLLLGVAGTAIAIGEIRGILGFVLTLIGWRGKSLIEERFMQEQFGDEYARYKREVKALIPFLW